MLEEEQVDCLAVAFIEEAITLREAGIKSPILLLEGFYGADELPVMEHYNLSVVIQQTEQIEILQQWQGKPFDIWLKLDTGMHRIGFTPEEFHGAHQTLSQCAAVRRIVLMTHFSSADEPHSNRTREQVALFNSTTSGLNLQTCLSNSAAVLNWPEAHGDWVRPGLMLYGSSPFFEPHEQADELQPVMELTSSIIAIRKFEPGVPIGYNGTFVTDRPMTMGVVAMGYADGYPRHAPSGTPVLVNGVRSRILGRISMDMMSIDLSHIPDAKLGDTVTLWGKDLPAAEVAHHAGTIAYELFCNMKRVPVHYVDEAAAATSQSELSAIT